jgi:leader peptidase (prepilin peptidase)/N-methyltransferase
VIETVQAWQVVLWAWFGAWAVALSVVDLREHRLPNRMVATALTGCVALTVMLSVAISDGGVLLRAMGASVVAVAAFGVAHVVGGMGMGDVKYAAVTGWALGTIGWSAVWWGHVLGFVAAGVVVMAGSVLGRMHRRSAVPFGPFMGLGSLVVGVAAVTSVAG